MVIEWVPTIPLTFSSSELGKVKLPERWEFKLMSNDDYVWLKMLWVQPLTIISRSCKSNIKKPCRYFLAILAFWYFGKEESNFSHNTHHKGLLPQNQCLKAKHWLGLHFTSYFLKCSDWHNDGVAANFPIIALQQKGNLVLLHICIQFTFALSLKRCIVCYACFSRHWSHLHSQQQRSLVSGFSLNRTSGVT